MINLFKKNKEYLYPAGIIFVLSRLAVILWILLIPIVFRDMTYSPSAYKIDIPIIRNFALYDTQHYINIANHGYNNGDMYYQIPGYKYIDGLEASFFPLYPLMIRLFSFSGLDPHIAGFVISNICFFLSLVLLKKLLVNLKIQSNMPLLMLAFFPSSMFLSAIYTESLFVFLVIACFYLAAEKKWWLSGITAFFAALTRSAGVGLCILLFFEYLYSVNFKVKSVKKEILSAFLPFLGLGSFLLFEYFKYGDFIAFYHSSMDNFGRDRISPFRFLIEDLVRGNFVTGPVLLNMVVCYILVVLFIFMCLDKNIRISYKLFALGILYLSISTCFNGDSGAFASNGFIRYILPCIPLFIYFGVIKNSISRILLAFFTFGLLYLCIPFALKYFIA